MGLILPNLFLKWLAVRELLKPPQSNAEIAIRIWGPNDGPSKFSKLLRGDYGCEADVAALLAEVVNKRLSAVRGAKGQSDPPVHSFRGTDFELPLFKFTQRLVEAVGVLDDETLDRAHAAIMAQFSPPAAWQSGGPQLAIEQYAATKFFDGIEAAPEEPPVFEIGRHKGQLAVDGIAADLLKRPVMTYAMFARDPAPTGARFWELPFGDVLRWIPSPFVPPVKDGRLMLMPQARPVQPLAGHFRATVVLVFDERAVARLDPLGAAPPARRLDEQASARFLTNLNRVAKANPESIALCAGEYIVRAPRPLH